MRELLFLSLVLVVLLRNGEAASQKQKLQLTPPGQKSQTSEDPGSATRLLFEDPRNKNSPAAGAGQKAEKLRVGVHSTCTDNMGMIHRSGDPGYDGCMRTFDKGISPSDEKRNKSIGITIGR